MNEGAAEFELRVKDDCEAFARLFELNYDRIFNYILYSTGDLEEALDLTSETFFKALRALDRFNPARGSFTAWLYAIASREIAMHFRRLAGAKKRIAAKTSDIRDKVPVEEIEDARKDLESLEDFMLLAPLLRKLSPQYREVLFLKFFEDKSLEEIADLLGRPLGTVKAQCSRGLKLLKKWMQPLRGPGHMEEGKTKTIVP
jgi:RNA polymerase sigma-70 factor, ECF subfamily